MICVMCAGTSVYADGMATAPKYTDAQAVAAIKQTLLKRAPFVEFINSFVSHNVAKLMQQSKEKRDALLESAYDFTGKGNEGDYLRWSVAEWKDNTELYDADTWLVNCDFYTWYKIQYFDSAEKEAKTAAAVNSIIKSLHLSGKTTYGKFQAIYDWIAKNVVFDEPAADASKYRINYSAYYDAYSAYGAAVLKKATCQGFSLLLYRMLNDAGVTCRIVTGKVTDEVSGITDSHMWNLVKIGSVYYQCDVTFDSYHVHHGEKYECCLKPSLSGHKMKNPATNTYCDEGTAKIMKTVKMATSAYSTVPMKKLTVKNGKGDGTYKEGSVITISPSLMHGQRFVKWEGSAKYTGGTSSKTAKAKIKLNKNTTLKAVIEYKPITNKEGKHKLKLYNGKYLTIKGGSKKEGAAAARGSNKSKSAVFRFIKSGNYYYIQNVHSGRYLGVKGTKVIQTTKNKAKKWMLVNAGDNKYRLILNGKSISGGTTLNTDKNTATQKFSLKKA